jgi:hypothetical protein
LDSTWVVDRPVDLTQRLLALFSRHFEIFDTRHRY